MSYTCKSNIFVESIKLTILWAVIGLRLNSQVVVMCLTGYLIYDVA